MREPNMASWNSERTSPSPCSPECEPLYSRTMAKASSAMARIFLASASSFQIEDRSHVQAADRGVGVPGAGRAVLVEDLGQAVGVVGQVVQRDGAVLDEGDRFAVALHGHHDVEAGLAHLPDRLLERPGRPPRPRRREAELAHQLAQLLAAWRSCCATLLAGELDQQQRLRRALGRSSPTVARKSGISRDSSIMVRSTSSTAVGSSVTMMPGRVHGLIEGREVADAQHLVRPGPAAGRAQSRSRRPVSLGADQQVARLGGALAGQGVDVVAADPAHQLGEARRDLIGLAPAQLDQAETSCAAARWLRSAPLPVAGTSPNWHFLPSASTASMARTLSRMVP